MNKPRNLRAKENLVESLKSQIVGVTNKRDNVQTEIDKLEKKVLQLRRQQDCYEIKLEEFTTQLEKLNNDLEEVEAIEFPGLTDQDSGNMNIFSD